MRNYDFLIIGAGVVGLTLAREIKARLSQASVAVLEKESMPGLHSSGRNSGVLHSGIYYPPESLKAKVCAQGCKEMAEYCEEHRLPLSRLGKVLVATRAEDDSQIDLLAQRAQANGVVAELLDSSMLKKLEPEARSASGRALFVPATAVCSPKAVMERLVREVQDKGINVFSSSRFHEMDVQKKSLVVSTGERFGFGHVINAAGLYADVVAHQFGVGTSYTMLPFKGLYWKLAPDSGLRIQHLIYPVPDLRVPFLGVHTTTTINKDVYLGPTAVPAFGRENYKGLQGTSPFELARICGLLSRQLYHNKNGFCRMAWQEGRRYFKPWFLEAAKGVLPRLQAKHLLPSTKVGIRAQLLERTSQNLVTDFLVQRGPHSTHILNAISPAWTCSFPFARLVADEYLNL